MCLSCLLTPHTAALLSEDFKLSGLNTNSEPALTMGRFGAILGGRHFSKRDQVLKGTGRTCPLCSANIVGSWGNITVILWFIIINTYLVFLPIPGTELLKLFQLPKWWKQWSCLLLFITSPFNHIGVYVNKAAVGKLLGHRRMGAGCQGSRPCD